MIYWSYILSMSNNSPDFTMEIDPKLIYLYLAPPFLPRGFNRCQKARGFLIGTHIVIRNCVSRNHGITGCRRLLMSLQGVPDRIISLVWAPRELFPFLLLPENRARRRLMSNRGTVSGCLQNNTEQSIPTGWLSTEDSRIGIFHFWIQSVTLREN